MVGRLLALSLVVLVVSGGCVRHKAMPVETTVAYMKILSESDGGSRQVGWLETRVKEDPDGTRTVISFVKNLDFDVRGYLRPKGMGVKYEDRSPIEKSARGVSRDYIELPRGSRAQLAAQILDLPIDTDLKFVTATTADLGR